MGTEEHRRANRALWNELTPIHARSGFYDPGGTVYIAEFHPFSLVFDDSAAASHLRVRYPYFPGPEPDRFEPEGSYADRAARVVSPSYEWTHTMSETLNSILEAGLRVEYLHEFPHTCYKALPCLERGPDGLWRLPGGAGLVPLTFSLKATK